MTIPAKLQALLDAVPDTRKRPPRPKPELVASLGEVVEETNVRVSRRDPNYRNSIEDGWIEVRRQPPAIQTVSINMREAERQWADRQRPRPYDPMNLWGGRDDD
jgi:hypothetical protein